MNEHAVKPVFVAGQVQRVPVATINVHHYQTNAPGTFKLFSDKWSSGVLAEHLHPTDIYPQTLRQMSFATESSLFLPFGHIYRLDFYIKDGLGRTTLQDQVTLDMMKE